MEVSISSYNETDEQRLIRLLTEQVANQDKLIKKQDEIIEMQKGQIRTRDEHDLEPGAAVIKMQEQ